MRSSQQLRKKNDRLSSVENDGKGKTMSPPPFQLSASSNAPIQRKILKLPNGDKINTKQMTHEEIRDLKVKLEFQGEDKLVEALQTALEEQDYDIYGGQKLWLDFLDDTSKDKEMEDEEDDLDYSEFVGNCGGMRLMEGGIAYGKNKMIERDNKKLPMNNIKGQMLELAFDQLREEEGKSNISSNSFVPNCPGIDHISPFGDRMFEQSKNHTSGTTKQITEAYINDYERSNKMGSTLFNKGSNKGITGNKINNMFSQIGNLSDLNKDQKEFGKKMNLSMLENIKNEEKGDFDSTHEDVLEFTNKFYMQVPSDIWPELAKKYKKMDGFMCQELSTEHMKEFETYVMKKGIANPPGKNAKRKNEEEEEYVPKKKKKDDTSIPQKSVTKNTTKNSTLNIARGNSKSNTKNGRNNKK